MGALVVIPHDRSFPVAGPAKRVSGDDAHANPGPQGLASENQSEPVQRLPVENQESPRTTFALTQLVESGADAVQVADAIVSTWQAINVALTPIIGRGGIAMLYKRSICLASAHHPWLADTHEGAHKAMDLSILKSVLVQQGSARAAAAGDTVLQTFHELLATLIGPSLTETLLRSIGANAAPDSPTAQDTAP